MALVITNFHSELRPPRKGQSW